jgi:parvulin-like peptidyl-prolyl isomerase
MNSSNKGALTLGLLLILPMGAGAKVMEDTVAVVNGAPILLSEFQKDLSEASEYWTKTMPGAMADPAHVKKLKEGVLEQLIDREVLYQEGVKLKLKVRERDIENGVAEIKARFSKDDAGKALSEAEAEAAFNQQLKTLGMTYAQFRERLSRQIMARKVIDDSVRQRVKPPEEKDVKAYFEKVKAFLVSGGTTAPKGLVDDEAQAFLEISQHIKAMSSERVRVSRILVKFSPNASEAEKKRALKTAQALRKKVVEGAAFADVAREESEDPESAARGGDIGLVVRGVAPPEFEKAAFSLPVGDVSEPIETDIGYHIIRVQEKRASEAPDLERFKEDLGRFLVNLSYQRELESFVKDLKSKAVIERHPPA